MNKQELKFNIAKSMNIAAELFDSNPDEYKATVTDMTLLTAQLTETLYELDPESVYTCYLAGYHPQRNGYQVEKEVLDQLPNPIEFYEDRILTDSENGCCYIFLTDGMRELVEAEVAQIGNTNMEICSMAKSVVGIFNWTDAARFLMNEIPVEEQK